VEIRDHLIKFACLLLKFRFVILSVSVLWNEGILILYHLAHPIDELFVASLRGVSIGEVNEEMFEEILLILGLKW
jgi:hypothetical protein